METDEEYQFVNRIIQSIALTDNEWYIGLTRKSGDWKWITGHNMTIDKWRPTQPSPSGDCAKMMKDNQGLGLFDNINCTIKKRFICEYEGTITALAAILIYYSCRIYSPSFPSFGRFAFSFFKFSLAHNG